MQKQTILLDCIFRRFYWLRKSSWKEIPWSRAYLITILKLLGCAIIRCLGKSFRKVSWKNQCSAILYCNVSYIMEFLAWWVLKSKVFAQNSTGVKLNCCILWIDIEWGLQKLGLILESKVVQKGSPKLIFLEEFFFKLKKFSWFLT